MPKQAGQTITSWVCPAAFSRHIAWVMPASIVERAVPSAMLPPGTPCHVIAILAVGISCFAGRTKDALGVTVCAGDYMPGHRGSCQHRKKDCGNANQSEFRYPEKKLCNSSHICDLQCRLPQRWVAQ